MEVASVGHHGTRFHAVAYAADGRLLALTDQILNQRRPKNHPNDYRIRPWDVTNLKELAPVSVFTAPDLPLVDVVTGKALHTLKGYGQWVCRLAFTPDGKTLAVGDYSGKVHLWNVAAGRLLLTIDAHAGPVTGLAFRGDGRVLASCNDTEIRLWRAETKE